MDSALKYKIVEKIIQTDDDELLNEINALLNLSETDFWTELPAELKKGINKAKDELERGEGIVHSQIMSEIKTRLQINRWLNVPLYRLQLRETPIIRY
jgi:hypothetical protein